MKKLGLFMLAIVAVASLQAITVNWKLYNYEHSGGTDFDGQQIESWATDISYALIVNAQQNQDFTSGTTVAIREPVAGGHLTYGAYGTLQFTSGALDSNLGGDYYLVIFETKLETADGSIDWTNSTYAVSSAVQYTDLAKVQGVEGEAPDVGNYVDAPWVGGTWSAPSKAPEPTVLALLALGVAGAALRRKVA